MSIAVRTTNLGGCVVKCSAHSTPGAKTSRIESKAGASVSNRRRLCTRYAHSPPKAGRASGRCHERADHAFESERQECGPQQHGGQAGNPHAAGKAARLAHSVNHRRCKSQSERQSDEKSPAIIRQYLCAEQRSPESKRHRQKEIAALPKALAGNKRARRESRGGVALASAGAPSASGNRQSTRKNKRLRNGIKNRATNWAGSPALHSRFHGQHTMPTQIKGRARATSVARNRASLPCRSMIRATSRTGTQ